MDPDATYSPTRRGTRYSKPAPLSPEDDHRRVSFRGAGCDEADPSQPAKKVVNMPTTADK